MRCDNPPNGLTSIRKESIVSSDGGVLRRDSIYVVLVSIGVAPRRVTYLGAFLAARHRASAAHIAFRLPSTSHA